METGASRGEWRVVSGDVGVGGKVGRDGDAAVASWMRWFDSRLRRGCSRQQCGTRVWVVFK